MWGRHNTVSNMRVNSLLMGAATYLIQLYLPFNSLNITARFDNNNGNNISFGEGYYS